MSGFQLLPKFLDDGCPINKDVYVPKNKLSVARFLTVIFVCETCSDSWVELLFGDLDELSIWLLSLTSNPDYLFDTKFLVDIYPSIIECLRGSGTRDFFFLCFKGCGTPQSGSFSLTVFTFNAFSSSWLSWLLMNYSLGWGSTEQRSMLGKTSAVLELGSSVSKVVFENGEMVSGTLFKWLVSGV